MAMIVISGNQIFKQEKDENPRDFCERIKLWEPSQPRHLPGMEPCPCGCGNLIIEGQVE